MNMKYNWIENVATHGSNSNHWQATAAAKGKMLINANQKKIQRLAAGAAATLNTKQQHQQRQQQHEALRQRQRHVTCNL